MFLCARNTQSINHSSRSLLSKTRNLYYFFLYYYIAGKYFMFYFLNYLM